MLEILMKKRGLLRFLDKTYGEKRGFEKLVHVKCNLFTHGAPRSSQQLVRKCPCIPGSNWNLEMLVFFRRGENRNTQRRTSRSRVEKQQQTQPTYM